MKPRRCLGFVLLFPLLFSFPTGPGKSNSVDFQSLSDQPEGSIKRKTRKRVSLSPLKRIWSSSRSIAHLETSQLDERLVWITASEKALYVHMGRALRLVPGEIQKKFRGQIVSVDVHPLPNRPHKNLVTVNTAYNNELIGRAFALTSNNDGLALRKIAQKFLVAIRPVRDRLWGQKFESTDLWQPSLYQLRSTQADYVLDEKQNLPQGSRLLSLTPISRSRFLILDHSGDLILWHPTESIARVSGNYGTNSIILQSTGDVVSKKPVRKPPVFVKGRNLVVVPKNPVQSINLQNWLFSVSKNASLHFFRLQASNLRPAGKLGPFQGPILDLESPKANPDQLLILRRTNPDQTVLEVTGFTPP